MIVIDISWVNHQQYNNPFCRDDAILIAFAVKTVEIF